MNVLRIKSWGLTINKEEPFLVSGPCSAETRTQVLDSCRHLAKYGVSLLRAGIWKPRTRPNSFEGVGAKGLPWIKEAGEITGLPVTVEVAKASHVEAALNANIDVLWIGARTTVNPFAVQEIADSLRGVDIPVMIKNPVSPDLELWIGAIERLYLAGIHKLAAIHRGFSVSKSTPYRNQPKWEIPIELRRRIFGLEVICDPSHICGKRSLLQGVAQKALDLNFDGLMLETHINPDKALSDALQQVTPEGLNVLMDSLVIREMTTDDPEYWNKLEELRQVIDQLDAEIIELLRNRMEVASEIGRYKKINNIKILDMERWRHIFATRMSMSKEANLSEDFANGLLQAIHKESIKKQTEVMNLKDL